MKIKAKVVKKPEIEKEISTDFIKLDAFLKMCDAVQSGGHAKIVIQSGEVKLNNEICTLRGKKLHKGDKVDFNKKIWIVK